MIAYLKGQILECTSESVIIDVNGVGYELLCSLSTLADLAGVAEARLYVFTHVREDALQLFGFHSKTEKELFLSLNKVNGIGPKLALKILSGASLERLIHFIETEDVAALSKLPKVGKKTAEQIVLSLKGKLVVENFELPESKRDIVSALVNLGFRVPEVEKVVAALPVETTLEDGVRLGLKALSSL